MPHIDHWPKVGDLIPVFWDTGDGRPCGQHLARVLEVMPYNGPLPFVRCIVKLSAPRTKRGFVEMSWCFGEMSPAPYAPEPAPYAPEPAPLT